MSGGPPKNAASSGAGSASGSGSTTKPTGASSAASSASGSTSAPMVISSPSASSKTQVQAQAQSKAQAASNASAGASPMAKKATTNPAAGASRDDKKPTMDPTDQAVLDYLKKRGMTAAVLELTNMIGKSDGDDKSETKDKLKDTGKDTGRSKDKDKDKPKANVESKSSEKVDPKKQNQKHNEQDKDSAKDNQEKKEEQQQSLNVPATTSALRVQLENDDNVFRNQRSLLTRSTGGGYGYDRDAVAPIVQWGVPDSHAVQKILKDKNGKDIPPKIGVQEARNYLNAFTSLQLWVLTLPDDNVGTHIQPKTHNPIQKAREIIETHQRSQDTKELSLSTIMKEMVTPHQTNRKKIKPEESFALPPSAKPELLSVTFALLVHTYCELLEVGMESTAQVLRDAFQPVYEPLYEGEYKDLFHCSTTEEVIKLNSLNSQHLEASNNLKTIIHQIARYQTKKEELQRKATTEASRKKIRVAVQECDQNISMLRQKHAAIALRASAAFDRLHDLPFLRRARAFRWQLTLSTASYGMLASFLNNNTLDESLLAMSTLLQTKCELHIERRHPLPFTPACILDDNRDTKRDPKNTKTRIYSGINENEAVNWAAPLPYRSKDSMEDDELPFPKFHLDEEYSDEAAAAAAKKAIIFNRAMLVNGFRRLEALERKRGYDVMSSATTHNAATKTSRGGKDDAHAGQDPSQMAGSMSSPTADAFQPSILLSTLCSDGPGIAKVRAKSSLGRKLASGSSAVSDIAGLWSESGIGLCCAKSCPPDGRYIAVGCDDAAVRIWNLKDQASGDGAMGDPTQVLLGHKNGFPVFDIDWNRDGRTLLSAGGDGSIRLWDTMAQGTFGDVGKPTPSKDKPKKAERSKGGSKAAKSSASSLVKDGSKITHGPAREVFEKATKDLIAAKKSATMTVPDLKSEINPYTSGAALGVYRGHAPNAPIWSVAFAPSGYYFASAGGDATARMWTTDRGAPVRLFAGHTSKSVNSVVFHPNCNYILTGADDKTARLWDVQTARCVRLLNGCSRGLNNVKISPCGRYASASDYSGIVHLWDLGTGKKMTELRPNKSADSASSRPPSMVHSLAFSSCGRALATGGDDCCVRVWDVQNMFSMPVVTDTPVKTYQTRRTILLDLQYTKRNLLLSVGKYANAISVDHSKSA